MTWVFEFYNFYNDELEDDILYEIDYFKLLDRYYRQGISFEDNELYPKKRILYEKKEVYNEEWLPEPIPSDDIRLLDSEGNFKMVDCIFGVKFENDNILPELLYIKEDFNSSYRHKQLIPNFYNLKQLIYNDVKKINLDDLDKGPITLSEVEKWKRKVINQQTDRKTRLWLLSPNVYHSLITFVVFYNHKKSIIMRLTIVFLDLIEKLIIIKINISIQQCMRIKYLIRLVII